MIYRPVDSAVGMWDTWIFPHEQRYHLFHLQRRIPNRNDEIGRAVSDDLIHWEVLPAIPLRGPKGAWDGDLHHTGLRTGFTIAVPDGFAMAYGALHEGREVVGMTFSKDLVRWEKCADNPVLCPGGEWYEHDPTRTAMLRIAWRDPFIEQAEGGYEAMLCARSASGEHGAKACVARAFSRDLIHWQTRPPLVDPGRYNSMECPERFQMDGRWYLTFSTGTEWGRPLSTPTRTEVHGGFYMVADHRDGPYRVPDDDLLLGAQLHSAALNADTEYAARTIVGPDGERLLYGQNPGQRTTFSTPKVLEADAAGRLKVKFWKKLLCLETGDASERLEGLEPFPMGNVVIGEWQISDMRAVARSSCDTTIAVFPRERGDFHWTCNVTQHSGDRFALLLRVDEDLRGSAIVFDFKERTISLAGARRGNQFGILFTPYDVIHQPLSRDTKYALRILARDELVEAYLDDVLLFSATQREHPRQGRIGLAVLGETEFSHHRIATLKPLE